MSSSPAQPHLYQIIHSGWLLPYDRRNLRQFQAKLMQNVGKGSILDQNWPRRSRATGCGTTRCCVGGFSPRSPAPALRQRLDHGKAFGFPGLDATSPDGNGFRACRFGVSGASVDKAAVRCGLKAEAVAWAAFKEARPVPPAVSPKHGFVQALLEVIPAQALAHAHGPLHQVRDHPAGPIQDLVLPAVAGHAGHAQVPEQTAVTRPAVGEDPGLGPTAPSRRRRLPSGSSFSTAERT